MLDIAIIADDLTGAADTGVQFCPYFTGTILLSYANFSPESVEALGFTIEALALYSNTRAVKAESARERLGHIARRLVSLQPMYTYKKVDSCLRGNLGAEAEAIMDEMGYDLSYIAPAFPEMGRTTLHDIHLIHGTPVDQTELFRDPVTPVTEPRLSRVVKAQARHGVGHVDVRFMEGTGGELAREIDRQVGLEARHLVFDATCKAHLDKIVFQALRSPKKILLVGSAGLAGSLGRHFPKRPFLKDSGPGVSPKGNHLMVCGTTSERTEVQISALIKAYPYEVMALSPNLLGDPTRREELLSKAILADSALRKSNLIVTIGASNKGRVGNHKRQGTGSPEEIVEGLGIFVAAVLKGTRPADIFLTGGDTANAILETLGAEGVRLFEEIVPGMVQGTIVGGPMNDLPVVTKAGGFGKEDALVSLHEYWRNRIKGGKNES
jgi:uncharacterized protein YgbK (DUF1537 family)